MRATSARHQRRTAIRFVLVFGLCFACGFISAPAYAQQFWDCADFPRDAAPEVASPTAVLPAGAVIPFPADSGETTIFAAASLTDVFTAIEIDIEAANPGVDLAFSFAGSQTLVTQLAEGAPADVFASANTAQMESAVDAGVISGEPSIFASNRLVIVVPADNPAGIKSIADLNNDGVKLVIASEAVPVGGYARASICAADAAGIEGAGFSDEVAANVVSNEANVRDVLAKVALGEADAGIVYQTDIIGDVSADVMGIEIPTELNVVASYPIAAVEGGKTAAAAAFISYVLSPLGQAALAEYGFS